MTYAMSDIHGCYDQYIEMLKKINFSDTDLLYVVGDVVDRGPEPAKVLMDMSMRPNVVPIVGNHDAIAYDMLRQLMFELTEENIKKHLGDNEKNFVESISHWQLEGGTTTIRDFGRLSMDDRESIIDYLSEFSLYKTVNVAGKRFILAHSGLPVGATLKNLDSFDLYDFVQAEVDYSKQYFDGVYLVTGHNPTFLIGEQHRGKIYRQHNHIAIDTGAGFDGPLACICLDTDEEFYVPI